ncbi:MAG: peptidylprolyl isomerase [Salinibacter sp.]
MDAPKFLLGLFLVAGFLMACSGSARTGESKQSQSNPEATVVARYADTEITLAELDSAFAASVGGRESAADTSLSAYRNFLDQYLNYRLKVRAARDAGLDTLASLQKDVHNYRQELARPRLMREKVYEPVARTLYERRNQAVDVSHILIRTRKNQDTTAAYRTIQKIADSLDRGVPFAELAYRNSDDRAARKKGARGYKGRIGYIRAGQIVKPFEKRMYTVKPGEVSDIFRTKYGYHILKVHDRRPARPPIQLSHILRRAKGDSAAARQFLDSLRTAILRDSLSFAVAAAKHSQDPRTATKGGDLGKVKPTGLPAALRKAAAKLDSVGAVSGVVRSRFGYHLLKLTGRQERKSFEKAYEGLKKKISGQPRVKQRKAAFARKVRAKHGVTVDTTALLNAADVASVDSLARPLLSRTDSASTPDPPVASLGDSTYTARQMARHLMQTDGGAQMTIAELIDSFLNEKALQYAATRLTQRDPSLAEQIRKYREGALLFRYMKDSVWTAAAQDSAGLRATYRKHRNQYRFPARVRTLVLRAPSDSLLMPYKNAYQEGRSFRATYETAAEDSLVSADTIYVTARSADVYQPVRSAKDLGMVGPKKQDTEWLLMIRDTRLPPRRKRFEEARSSVVQDHQKIYEQQVIQRLRNRYDAKTYPERLRPPFSGTSSTR